MDFDGDDEREKNSKIDTAETFFIKLNRNPKSVPDFLKEINQKPITIWTNYLKEILKRFKGNTEEALVYLFEHHKFYPKTLIWMLEQLSIHQKKELLIGFSKNNRQDLFNHILPLIQNCESFLTVYSCETGNHDLLKLLLNYYKETPDYLKPVYMQKAIDSGSYDCVCLLIQAGLPVEEIYLTRSKKDPITVILTRYLKTTVAEKEILLAIKNQDYQKLEQWAPMLQIKNGAFAEKCIHWSIETMNKEAFDLFVKNGYKIWETPFLLELLRKKPKGFSNQVKKNITWISQF